jgi:hypothetical protein
MENQNAELKAPKTKKPFDASRLKNSKGETLAEVQKKDIRIQEKKAGERIEPQTKKPKTKDGIKKYSTEPGVDAAGKEKTKSKDKDKKPKAEAVDNNRESKYVYPADVKDGAAKKTFRQKARAKIATLDKAVTNAKDDKALKAAKAALKAYKAEIYAAAE